MPTPDYRCPVCGAPDLTAYTRCNRPDCTDGRDPRPVSEERDIYDVVAEDWRIKMRQYPPGSPLYYGGGDPMDLTARSHHCPDCHRRTNRTLWFCLAFTVVVPFLLYVARLAGVF
jgi:RNA polymerase subunit RPABC4/transcription elongation factor Spt4